MEKNFTLRIIQIFSLHRRQTVGCRPFPIDQPNDSCNNNDKDKDNHGYHPSVDGYQTTMSVPNAFILS